MSEPAFPHRIREAAAGRALPEIVGLPPAEFREPELPTTTAEVDGILLSPASRLTALAAIRDAHRAAARAASDRAHDHRDAITEATRRVGQLEVRAGADASGLSPVAETELAALAAEVDQLTAARDAALAEAAASSASAGDADRLLKACLSFARDQGFTLPVTLAREARS